MPKRFFVEEITDAAGAVLSFGVMDREHPDEIVADFCDREAAEDEATLCNCAPDDYDAERRYRLSSRSDADNIGAGHRA
jgi:hypothetical protein